MSEKVAAQTLLTQLETALHRLVESFWEEPYRFFTEADAVAALHTWVARRPELAQVYHTADGFETNLLHREYPTFFRFKVSDPSQRLGPPARRGHYDLALLNPAYVGNHDAEAVSNRNIGDRGDLSTPPLLAAVEFKLFNNAWNPVRVRSVRGVLGKLRLSLLSPPHATAAYLCVFQRHLSPNWARWEDNWPTVEKMLADAQDIRSVVAVCWPKQEREPFVHYSGPWITTGQSYM
jgi:hypothetical protein